MTARKTIGETNGIFGVLFKFALVTHPFVIMWASWMTVEQLKDISARGPKVEFTQLDGKNLKEELQKEMRGIPVNRQDIDYIKDQLRRLTDKVDNLR